MKKIARSIAFDSFSLFILSQMFSGVRILGGLPALLFSGAILSLLSVTLKPLLKVLSFPLNAITFGAFSIVINAIVLYVLTLLVKEISIHAFTWQGVSYAGFVVPKFSFGTIMAFLLIAIL